MNPLVSATLDSVQSEKPAVKEEETTTKTFANNPAINTQPSEQNIKPEIISPAVSEVSSGEYCVITGSFKSESNASVLKKKLEGEGYSPEIIPGPNGFYRVSAVKCRTLSEANTIKEKLGTRYSGAWITRVK
jgi:cell division septation protein DedD